MRADIMVEWPGRRLITGCAHPWLGNRDGQISDYWTGMLLMGVEFKNGGGEMAI
jgi:hypothetical protein